METSADRHGETAREATSAPAGHAPAEDPAAVPAAAKSSGGAGTPSHRGRRVLLLVLLVAGLAAGLLVTR